MSAKPELILHIGRHKCGTSSLQRFLCANDRALEELGLHYTVLHRQPYAHHPVAHFYADSGSLDETAVAGFWNHLVDHPRSIVSSEAFQNIDPQRMVPHLKDFEVTIVAYFREPLDYLYSSYAQRVKAGNTAATFEEYAAHFYVPYHDFMAAWQAALPHATIKARLFDRAQFHAGDVRADFMKLAGLDETQLSALDYVSEDGNPSIGGPLLEFVRALVPHRVQFGEDWWEFYAAVQRLALEDPALRARPTVPRMVQQQIRDRHYEQNLRFERDFLPPEQHFSYEGFPEGSFKVGLLGNDAEEICKKLSRHKPVIAQLLKKYGVC